jgi:hypothetical protein
MMLVFLYPNSAFGQAQEDAAPATPQIVQPIDEGKMMQLKGNTHPSARPEFDEGAVAPSSSMDRILLVLQRSPEREAALEQFMKEQLDPASPNFHRWLSPVEFGAQFGPADEDIQKVTGWLESHGFTVNSVSKGRVLIDFSGTAGQVSEAFHTEIHHYLVLGEEHTANASDPEIPAALAPVIAGIYSLHDFYSKPLHRIGGLMRRSGATGKWSPADQSNPQFFTDVNGEDYELITPYDFATIYNVLPLWNASTPIDGTGQKVAIAGRSDVVLSDVATFRSDFGLPVNAPTVIVNGADPGVPTEGDQIENTLDIEWSGAVAKGATIDFVTSKNTSNTGGDFLSDEYIVDNDVAPVMSSSYGNCELNDGTGGNAAINSLWQQAATEGIAVFISAGDQGSAGCDSDSQTPPDSATEGLQVNGLASTPYNVAVGGTDFDYIGDASTYWNSTNAPTTQASAKGYVPEIPWNLTCTNPVVDTILGFGGEETTCNYIKTHSVDTFLLTIGGGSGGVSACTTPSGSTPTTCSGGYAKPSWQIGVGVPADGLRDLPDVSLFAANGLLGSAYLVCVSSASPDGTCSFNNANDVLALSVGGTSVSSPAMAGVMALVNQKMGTPQGEPNSVFYQLAALDTLSSCNASTVGNGSACIFYDTTSGTNAMPCATASLDCVTATNGDTIGVLSGYSSTTGYDLTTGLGSANVANLVDDWTTVVTAPAVATTLTYNGPTTFTSGSPANLSAVLTQTTGGSPVAGASVLFTLGSGGAAQTCSGITSANGTAICSIASVNQTAGAGAVTALFAGNASYLTSTSGPVAVTILAAPAGATTLAYTGPTTFTDGSAANLSAVLTRTTGGSAVVGVSVLFTLGSGGTAQTCSGITNSTGTATCSITSVNQTAGSSTLTASFAGNTNYLSSTSGPIAVTIAAAPAAATTLMYTGPTTFTNGSAANLSAVLTQTTGGSPVVGVSIVFTIGSGGTAQTCSGTTNSSGTATCTIASVHQTAGASTDSESFAGNASDQASSGGPTAVTIDAAPAAATTLTYNGPTTFTDGSAANLSAVLTQTTGGSAVAGVSVLFTLGSGGTAQTCSGTTNSAGTATCSIASLNQTAGSSSVSVSFAGNASDLASSAGPVAVTIAAAATTLTYTGPATFTNGSAANLSAVLTQTSGGAPVAGASVLFTLGSGSGGAAQTCSGITIANGTASCAIASVNQTVGLSSVSASFAGNSTELASSAGPLTVTILAAPAVATTLTYNGPTIFTIGGAANLSAVLTQSTGGSAVVGVSVLFTLGSGGAAQTCSGVTGSNGTATCSIATVNQTAGADTVSASFAGNASDLASTTGPVAVTISAAPAAATTLAYTGPTTFTNGSAANLSAVLTKTTGGTPIVGVSVLFTLGSGGTAQSCSGVTSANGTAACSIASVSQNAGASSVSASFAGNASFLASSAGPVAVTIVAAPTTLTYNGPTSFTDGSSATLSAVLTITAGGGPVAGVSIVFTLGSGGTAQTCSGVTGANGTATCTIATVSQTAGSRTVSASFAGNTMFVVSSAGPVTITIVDFTVSVTAGSQTVVAGGSAVFTISTAPLGGSSTISVTFTATGLPAETVATFNPVSVAPGASTTLTVTTTARPVAATLAPSDPRGPELPRSLPGSFPAWLACLVLAMLVAGAGFAGFARRPLGRLAPVAALILLVVAAGYIAGCAGNVVAAPTGTPAGTYTITVTGTSGTDVHSTSVTLVEQ